MEDLEPLYTSYLDEELYLNLDGRWHHDGIAFEHPRLASLFHRSIQWDNELQCYVVRIGKGRATFRHDGFVYFVIRLEDEDSKLKAILSNEQTIDLQHEKLAISADDDVFLLHLELKEEGSTPIARFTRRAQQEILQYAESERSLTIGDNTFIVPFYEEDD